MDGRIGAREHDGCGIGFVAQPGAGPSHRVLQLALEALARHAHRGALSADGRTGDGAGLLTALPYALLAREIERLYGAKPPEPEDLAAGMVFAPRETGRRLEARRVIERGLAAEGLERLGWRTVPTAPEALGEHARASAPAIEQVLVRRGAQIARGDAFEHALYRARKRIRALAREAGLTELYLPSLSHRTIVYKGLLMAPRLAEFYPDLRDPDYTSPFAIFHQRYSTNTRSSWRLAQPLRMLCHNGEINTLQGNVAWMRAREAAYRKLIWGESYERFHTVIDQRGSDSAILDNSFELLVRMGYDPRHALLMMVPEAWEGQRDPELPGAWIDFYRYHESLLEPWDGPAAIVYTDGRQLGVRLDRNGLRPVRFAVCSDGFVLAASEPGALDLPPERIERLGMLGAGEGIAIDLETGRLFDDAEIKDRFAHAEPYGSHVARRFKRLRRTRVLAPPREGEISTERLVRCKVAVGYSHEEEIAVLRPMVVRGGEPVGSMGDDTPLPALSRFPRLVFDSVKQRFAQVTNPPIDPIRERVVMSLRTLLGRRGNVLDPVDEGIRMLELEGPVLDPGQFAAITAHRDDPAFLPVTLDATWPVAGGAQALAEAIERLEREALAAVEEGHTLLILSDRAIGPERTLIPSLLATSAVHHHLVRHGRRLRASLVLDTAEPREVHHVACLLGFGADAIHPYLAYAAVRAMLERGGRQLAGLDLAQAIENLIAALQQGLRKIMAKMGIAVLASYRGAQTFELLGLDPAFAERYLPATVARAGGIGLERMAADLAHWHALAFGPEPRPVPSVGLYKYKRNGEVHAFRPEVVHALHRAVGLDPKRPAGEQTAPALAPDTISEAFRRYEEIVHARAPIFLRDLLEIRSDRAPVPLEEVEGIERILARMSTGAMSHGALSAEAHETLAIAMNRIGAASNSGEGGEAPERYGTERNSAIKQVASGRFGVSTPYLVSARELQIKIAQGSKPGEGGQLPGHKVTDEIARNRHTTPGVALISPPPHHDIYSIEDLAQLIHDLKEVNPEAHVSVKLVAETGVGTIACGVAKGWADVIQISGASGGTGASPLSSIRHAGMPWELGLAETQRALVDNGLRDRVRLRVDGTLQTSRDVLIALLLGADEVSFGTAAMIAEGCIMARTCHTNNCPVGVATQRRTLRDRFPGLPEHVASFFVQLASRLRERLAELGARSVDEIVGRTEWLRQRRTEAGGGLGLDLSELLWSPPAPAPRHVRAPRNDPPRAATPPLAHTICTEVLARLEAGARSVVLGEPEPIAVRNTDRAVGARLAGALVRRYGARGLRRSAVTLRLRGTAGQSFGAFLPRGVRLELEGQAADYVGKGLSGGEIVLRPPAGARFEAHRNVIAGNTVLYGASSGRLFAAGRVGQRFCVRNSGALAVIEGAGAHACEYMTGGLVVVLGPVGPNFGAGMTGGVAYVYDEQERLPDRVRTDLVEPLRITDPRHEEELLELIALHAERTGSARAREILDRWDELYIRFWRVAP
ncbi:MAG: glutamate synthase large subunit, partial [Planctomycetota bacterium]